jgi:hypothetical protein
MAETTKQELGQTYWDAIRRRVCGVCLDQSEDGGCGLQGRVCAIESHLPRLVDAIVSVDSDRIDDYVDVVRAEICPRCPEQDLQGRCNLRVKSNCALDSYLFLVVDAIQEVREAGPSALPSSSRLKHGKL